MNWLACFNSWPARAKTRKIYLKRSLNGRFNNLPCTFCLSPQFDSSEKEVRLKWKGNEMWMTIMKTMATVNSKLIYRLLEKKLNFPCFAWELTHFFSLVTQTGNWDLHYSRYEIFRFQNVYNYYTGTTAVSIDVTNSKIVQFSCFVHFQFLE